MKFKILHEIPGRMRIHAVQKNMTFLQADTLAYYLENLEGVKKAKVYERTADAVIFYQGDRSSLIRALRCYSCERNPLPVSYAGSSRELNSVYQEKLMLRVLIRLLKKFLVPAPVRCGLALGRSVRYILEGLRCLRLRKLEVPVLDATAITAALLRGQYETAGSIMFLLDIGELLEEWTHKKSVEDLARTMSLNTGKVWLKMPEGQVLVSTGEVGTGDEVVVHMGSVIPFDGTVTEGEAMVNQASLTGESVPVAKRPEASVYAGTVVDEGELTICVKAEEGASRYDKIVRMIEDSEKLKSSVESKAEHLADRLVSWTLGGTLLTWLITRNVTRAMSILMVDFCCALKLAMPVSVLSAIREAGERKMTVKGGKFLEAVADADTIVFDKTGTLTKAHPTVVDVVSFDGQEPDELLRIAACLEEHFPHSMASAVVEAARDKGLEHEEMHTKVEYIVAHGISTTIDGRRVIIGSYHFVFEDEGCRIPPEKKDLFDGLPEEYSHLYMAIEDELAAVICIQDPLRPEAAQVIRKLHEAGIAKVVMMTGDSRKTAAAVAARVGVDEFYAEVLPEDKAAFVEKEKAAGRKVMMIGDGINDSPALSSADVGVAISDGAQIAREIADITISAENLSEIVTLKHLSNGLMRRIHSNYRKIVGFNSGLILLGVLGLIQPATSALLHNTSTIVIGLGCMKNLLSEE